MLHRQITKDFLGRVVMQSFLVSRETRKSQAPWLLLVLLVSVLVASGAAYGAKKDGFQISGKLIDAQTGEPVVGGAIQIEGTSIGALSDIDGNYVVRKVPEGVHNLIVKCVGYSELRVEEVTVGEGETPKLDLTISPETIETGITVTVKAERVRNTEASLLKERQLSLVVSDAISSETISRSGSGDAASAVKRVTGASIVGGKFVYVRGLGDRYANTKINGSPLPSPDPDKQSVPMDVIPSGLLDNIVVEKTFTPDKPGNFAGGSVNLNTKQLAGEKFLKFSSSMGYNTNATFKDEFLSYPGGSKDWLGMDDGGRDIPDIVADPSVKIENPVGVAKRDSTAAYFLDEVSRSFNTVMTPQQMEAPLDQSYSLSYGNSFPVFERNMSILASLSYSRSYKGYDSGTIGRWSLPVKDVMYAQQYLSDSKGVDEVLWGTLVNLSIPVSVTQKLGVNYTYTRNAESQARYLVGRFPEAFPNDNQFFQTRVLRYTERDIGSLQFFGEHQLSKGRAVRMDWQATFSSTNQDDPDFRTFSNNMTILESGDTIYDIQSNQNPMPSRTWRELDEKSKDFNFNVSIPFVQWSDQEAKFKLGSSFLIKDRDHIERTFDMNFGTVEPDFSTPEELFSEGNFGMVDTVSRYYWFKNVYKDDTFKGHTYNSAQEIFALYSMVELPISSKLSVITGARYEKTIMDTENADTTGMLHDKDVLPSLNFIYKLKSNMNLRMSYGKTLARPSLREFAPFASQEYQTGFSLSGNPKLKRTLIDNYDVRWELFARPGEILAVSGFYKKFKNPIERAVLDWNGHTMFVNVDEATLYGAEFEMRMKLDKVHSALRHFQIGGNLTLIHSEVDIPEREMRVRRSMRPDADDKRPMQGQSPYVINLDIGYVNAGSGTSVALFYNVFGERLYDVTLDATPYPYEQPRHLVDLNMSQRVYGGLSFKAAAKNVFNEKVRIVHEYEGEEYIREEHSIGRSFSAGLSFDF